MSEREWLLYRWDSFSQGPLYFTVLTELWEAYDRDDNERTVLARGTEDEMNRLLKLFKEE
jgi:hypothetical protein